jgi:hypothetical protein
LVVRLTGLSDFACLGGYVLSPNLQHCQHTRGPKLRATTQSFDELLLMKRGGRIIFHGPLGHQSCKLIEYFQVITCFITVNSICATASCTPVLACKTSRGLLPDGINRVVHLLQSVEGVDEIQDGYNPATWALEVTNQAAERRVDRDFADVYADSQLHKCALLVHVPFLIQSCFSLGATRHLRNCFVLAFL